MNAHTRRALLGLTAVAWLSLGLSLSACETAAGDKPIGAVCATSAECASGICGGSQCLDPAGDQDGDGLINEVEFALGSNPAAVDTDGDGIDDFTEVGDINNPPDSDGDGKIDATESNQRDKDHDCLVDELDPFDTISNAPGLGFPGACGGPSSPSEPSVSVSSDVDCGLSPLDGTCAAPLGEMVFDCFAPRGQCLYLGSGGEEPERIEWDNGARIEWFTLEGTADGTLAGRLIGPSGELCGTLREPLGSASATAASVPTQIFQVGEAGPVFGFSALDDEYLIECPDDDSVTLTRADSDRFSECAGLTVGQSCQLVTSNTCTRDADCDGGRCCPVSGAEGMGVSVCMEVETCPIYSDSPAR